MTLYDNESYGDSVYTFIRMLGKSSFFCKSFLCQEDYCKVKSTKGLDVMWELCD